MKHRLTVTIAVDDSDRLAIRVVDGPDAALREVLSLLLPDVAERPIETEPGWSPEEENPVKEITGAMAKFAQLAHAGNQGNAVLVSTLNLVGDMVRQRLVEWGLNLPQRLPGLL